MNRIVIIEQEQIVITKTLIKVIDLDQPELTPEEKLLNDIFSDLPDEEPEFEVEDDECCVGLDSRDEALASFGTLLSFNDCPEVEGLELRDISGEHYREYDNGERVYRISDPVALYFRNGGLTHRVVDANGVSHCIPFPSDGSVALRWENRADVPVNF